VQSNWN